MGVMVSATLLGALDGAACVEDEIGCIVSCESLEERGLGSLPGGDESELVKGVRACREIFWPERDMVEGAEKVEEAGVGAEESESTSSSRSLGRRASFLGEFDLFLSPVLRVSPAIRVAGAVEAGWVVADGPGRCEASRRRDLSSLSPRLLPDMDLIATPSH
jgi:hypothetical protein